MPTPYPDIAAHLPVEISGASVDGAVLNIWGIDWALTIAGPWEGTIDGRSIYPDDADLAEQLTGLTGEALLGVGRVDLDDVGFQLSNGVLFVAPHPTEPAWRLRLPHDEFLATPGSS